MLTGEHEHPSRWAAIQSIATKIGCTPETLRSWVNKLEVDAGTKPGVTTDLSTRLPTTTSIRLSGTYQNSIGLVASVIIKDGPTVIVGWIREQV